MEKDRLSTVVGNLNVSDQKKSVDFKDTTKYLEGLTADQLFENLEFTKNPMDNVIAQSVLTKCDGRYREVMYKEDIMAQIEKMSYSAPKKFSFSG